MVNQTYIEWLVDWIINGIINIQTKLPFIVDDIKNINYREAVEVILNNQ